MGMENGKQKSNRASCFVDVVPTTKGSAIA